MKLVYERLQTRFRNIKEEKRKEEFNYHRKKAMEVGVIRTYNFQHNEVKDHKTGKTAKLKKFLDGNIHLLK